MAKKSETSTTTNEPAQESTERHEPGAKPEAPKRASTAELVKKISAKTVNDGEDVPAPKEPTPLFTIIGIVQGFEIKESQYGPSVGFKGNFEAIRWRDGKRFISGTLYLPTMLADLLHASVRQAQADDVDATVKVAGVVGLKPSKKAAVGYEFTFTPLIEVTPVDALADLRATIALPAPSTSDASAA